MWKLTKLTGLMLALVGIVIGALQLKTMSPRAVGFIETTTMELSGIYGSYDGMPVTYINWEE